jgi:hypothetical protein
VPNRRRPSGPHRELRPEHARPLDLEACRVAAPQALADEERRSGQRINAHDREAAKWAKEAGETIEAEVWAAEEDPQEDR